MTSQTSFANTAEGLPRKGKRRWFPFKSAFSTGAVLFNAGVFLFVWLVPLINVPWLTLHKIANPELIYYFKPNGDTNSYFIVLVTQAMITAILLFRFMLNKRASVTYMALPVSRTRLFWSRYAAGLVLIFLPHLINMTWLLYVNIRALGFSVPMMWGYTIVTGGTLVTLLTAYSITAALCLSAGTVVEGFAFPLTLVFGGLFLPSCATTLFSLFLYGNALGESYGPLTNLTLGAVNNFAVYWPVINFLPILDRFVSPWGSIEQFSIRFWQDGPMVGPVIIVVWAILSVGISFLAYRAFKRYKAERAGSLGVNRLLNFFGTFVIVCLMFSTGCMAVNTSEINRLILGLAFSLAAFLLCRFLLTLNLKKAFALQGFKAYGLILAIIGLVCVFSLTGMFGYSTYQPNPEEVSYAKMVYTGVPDFIPGSGYEFGNQWNQQYNLYDGDIVVREYEDLMFFTKNDIQTVLDLHKELIDAGPGWFNRTGQKISDPEKDRVKVKVYVTYMLKNGKQVSRLYKYVSAQVAMDLLNLDNTDTLRGKTGPAAEYPLDYDENKPVKITDGLFDHEYTLAAEDYKALFTALQKDIDRLPLQEKYYPTQPAQAVISYQRPLAEGGNAAYLYSGNTTVHVENGTVIYDTFYYPYMQYTYSTQYNRFFITEGYTHTLAFLREKGILPDITAPEVSSIAEMHVQRYRMQTSYETQSLYFRAYVSEKYEKPILTLSIGTENYADMLRLARTHYYVAEGGFLVKIRTIDSNGIDRWTTLFLPEKDVPDYIRAGFPSDYKN